MKIRRRVLSGFFAASVAPVIAITTFVWQSSPAKAFHPCPPFHRADHIGRLDAPVCVPEVPAGNIPTNPRELSEEVWGQAGQAVYRQGSEAMLARASARGSSPLPLDEYQKRYLRPHFGNLVDNVVVFYNVPPLDDWQILGMTINNSHTAAQTFCERIFVNGQYNSTDRTQLILLAHELVHSQQCQRLGGVERFGYEYFRAYKRANLNYANISLEQEAYAFEARFEESPPPVANTVISSTDSIRGWSWDGTTASYITVENGQNVLYVQPFDGQTFGSVISRQIFSSTDSIRGWSWDGTTASYVAFKSGDPSILFIRPFDGRSFGPVTEQQVFSDTDSIRGWSWDGTTASYITVQNGRNVLYVRPFDGQTFTFGSVTSSQTISSTDSIRGWDSYNGTASYVTVNENGGNTVYMRPFDDQTFGF